MERISGPAIGIFVLIMVIIVLMNPNDLRSNPLRILELIGGSIAIIGGSVGSLKYRRSDKVIISMISTIIGIILILHGSGFLYVPD